jgi:hypothetical protein
MTSRMGLPILLCALIGMVAGASYVALIGTKYGWREARTPETWAVAILVGIGGFLVAMLHPDWMPRDIWSRDGSR